MASIMCSACTGLTLEKDGHVVHTASSGEMALSMSSTTRYDVIVIDINMPVLRLFYFQWSIVVSNHCRIEGV